MKVLINVTDCLTLRALKVCYIQIEEEQREEPLGDFSLHVHVVNSAISERYDESEIIHTRIPVDYLWMSCKSSQNIRYWTGA